MDTARFEHGAGFLILDLWTSCAFKSATSISFLLGRYSDTLTCPVGDEKGSQLTAPARVFKVAGRLDVHHPCEGHILTQLLVVLPVEYHAYERMQQIVDRVFEVLGIPADETFEAHFVAGEKQTSLERARNREGCSDRSYSY